MKNNYDSYDESQLQVLLNEPWEVSDRPYLLHASYALNCLSEICISDEEDNEDGVQEIWGSKVPKRILDRLVEDVSNDFNDAAANHKQIVIQGKRYSIRKVNAYDKTRLKLIFDFPTDGDDYIVTKEGVKNLSGTPIKPVAPYNVTPEELRENRNYLRQIIMLAEDDENNGWDKLTDMEIVVYCWALFYNKEQYDSLLMFRQRYKDYIYVCNSDIQWCFNSKAFAINQPQGMYTFSKERVTEWNRRNKQPSEALKIPQSDADDYWYNVALKHTFKPIDFHRSIPLDL